MLENSETMACVKTVLLARSRQLEVAPAPIVPPASHHHQVRRFVRTVRLANSHRQQETLARVAHKDRLHPARLLRVKQDALVLVMLLRALRVHMSRSAIHNQSLA